jgi:asparagine synthase (glutamine-hydrolysing)
MCGIAGAVDVAEGRAAARVRLLNDAQRHRGPDHNVVARVGGFTLGNTRLAVQDPGPTGNQPFVSADGRYYCVFNGEIYNHRQLTERYGLPGRTACDGEVIPELWAKLGPASLAELRGMFAIALVDSVEERLYLARDPFGIKPLHWRVVAEGLIFASEIRPLARLAAGARIDHEAVARYLNLGAIASDRTPFLEITALPPNSVAVFDRSSQATIRPISAGAPLLASATTPPLEPALLDSVELHLGADVPSALLLSAGVDSALIAAASRRLGRDLDCLTVAAEGGSDESEGAAQTASRYGHRFARIPAVLTETDITAFFAAMQRPSIDGLNTYLVAKAVHEAGFKVALSGLGGDEAVGGYSHFRLLRCLPALRCIDRLPVPVGGSLARLASRTGLASEAKARILLAREGPRDPWGISFLQREVLPRSLAADLTGVSCPTAEGPALASASNCPPSPFAAMVAAEVTLYLQAMLLPDADAFSMASSVELRVPFVYQPVFSASLGLATSGHRPPGKQAIGTALADPYLQRLARQPKRGFSIPMQSWMEGPLAPVLRAASAPDAAVWSVVDRTVAERAGLVPLSARDRWAEPWTLAALNAWLTSLSDAGQMPPAVPDIRC